MAKADTRRFLSIIVGGTALAVLVGFLVFRATDPNVDNTVDSATQESSVHALTSTSALRPTEQPGTAKSHASDRSSKPAETADPHNAQSGVAMASPNKGDPFLAPHALVNGQGDNGGNGNSEVYRQAPDAFQHSGPDATLPDAKPKNDGSTHLAEPSQDSTHRDLREWVDSQHRTPGSSETVASEAKESDFPAASEEAQKEGDSTEPTKSPEPALPGIPGLPGQDGRAPKEPTPSNTSPAKPTKQSSEAPAPAEQQSQQESAASQPQSEPTQSPAKSAPAETPATSNSGSGQSPQAPAATSAPAEPKSTANTPAEPTQTAATTGNTPATKPTNQASAPDTGGSGSLPNPGPGPIPSFGSYPPEYPKSKRG